MSNKNGQNKTAVITIQTDQLEWIRRHPDKFVNGLVTRIESDETDKYPGYARWNGDGIPGTQLIWVSDPKSKHQTCIISAGNGTAVKIMLSPIENNSKKETKLKFLQLLAEKFGYKLVKTKEARSGFQPNVQ